MDNRTLPPLSDYLLSEFDKAAELSSDKTISVNPVVSDVATLYEKFRNAMDYREEDVLLRAAIERILKRRLLLGGSGEEIASPLVRELLWARYFPDGTIPESVIKKIANKIDLYLKLQNKINEKHRINRGLVNEWIMHLMSCEVTYVANPNKEKELLTNFMYQLYRERVQITDDTQEIRDVQVYAAVRRSFGREDLPLLRFHLFKQIFDDLAEHNLDKIAQNFPDGYKEIEKQLSYLAKDRIQSFIKKQTIPFFILEDVFKDNKGSDKRLVQNITEFNTAVINACSLRYSNIKSKVKTAILRGVIFVFVTKAIFALAVEGSFESLVYGGVSWGSIGLNTLIPPLLMIVAGLFIKTPGKENSLRILERIHKIIYNPASLEQNLIIKKKPIAMNPFLYAIFIFLWLIAFGLGFGTIIYLLSLFHLNPISQIIFLFFLAIVSFISFRINQTAHMYTMTESKQNFNSILFDFFFMPFIQLGRNLTENISKLNLFLFIFDFIIEAPFKGIFAFFEEWFLYLRTQREKLG